MTQDLIRLFENTQKLPELYEQIKDLPTKALLEQYGKITEVKIIDWALNCLLAFTLHQQGYTFREIQELILNNTQSPFYISIETLWRDSWIWENILSKASHFLKDPYLSKSWYKRMSQHGVEKPIKELEYIALRKQEESQKHKKYSISRWEEERGYDKKQQKEYICDLCKEEAERKMGKEYEEASSKGLALPPYYLLVRENGYLKAQVDMLKERVKLLEEQPEYRKQS